MSNVMMSRMSLSIMECGKAPIIIYKKFIYYYERKNAPLPNWKTLNDINDIVTLMTLRIVDIF